MAKMASEQFLNFMCSPLVLREWLIRRDDILLLICSTQMTTPIVITVIFNNAISLPRPADDSSRQIILY
jgi:hypothetical protein